MTFDKVEQGSVNDHVHLTNQRGPVREFQRPEIGYLSLSTIYAWAEDRSPFDKDHKVLNQPMSFDCSFDLL